MVSRELVGAQKDFIWKYGSDGGQAGAIHDALLSALQRNRLYRCGLGGRERAGIRDHWGEWLVMLGTKYSDSQTASTFERDVLALVAEMNSSFGPVFCESGFRISHAQKSLSVYLKHLWCMGVARTPPGCPIDRMILTYAKAPENLRTWTSTNDLERHRAQFAWVVRCAEESDLPVAEWELLNFPGTGRAADRHKTGH